MMIGLRQELPGQSRHGSAACRSPGTAACRGARGCPHHTAAGAVLRGAARKPAAWPCCTPQPHTRPSKYLCHMLGKVYFSLQICIPLGSPLEKHSNTQGFIRWSTCGYGLMLMLAVVLIHAAPIAQAC